MYKRQVEEEFQSPEVIQIDEDEPEDLGASPSLPEGPRRPTRSAKKRKVISPAKTSLRNNKISTQRSPQGGKSTSGNSAQKAKPSAVEAILLKEIRETKAMVGGMEGMEDRLGERISTLEGRLDKGIKNTMTSVKKLEVRVIDLSLIHI